MPPNKYFGNLSAGWYRLEDLVFFFFFFFKDFQLMTSTFDDSFLSLDQDINQFFYVGGD